jgi:membrane protease YdiL (CAAX protease family)
MREAGSAAGLDRGLGARFGRLRAALIAGPAYPPDAADRRTFTIAGLELPLRATLVVAVATLVQIFDYSETFLPADYHRQPWGSGPATYLAVQRTVLFGLLPLAVVMFAMRDRPGRYGLGLGDVRWGVALASLGTLLMLPVILAVVQLPDFRTYYAPFSVPLPRLLLTHSLDLVASEFLYRGFLMMTLIRAIGPFGVVVALLPFAFAHLGKPDPDVLTTLAGGLASGWLAWRTGSIWYGAAAHVAIYTFAIVAAAAAAAGVAGG